MRRVIGTLAIAGTLALGGAAGAKTAPGGAAGAKTPPPGSAAGAKTVDEGSQLVTEAQNTVDAMTSQNPQLRPLLNRSGAYIVFPHVAEGGQGVGGAAGKGVVFENGRVTGYATLSKVSAVAIPVGQKYAELLVVGDASTLARMRDGKATVSAGAPAVASRPVAAASRPVAAASRPGVAGPPAPSGGNALTVFVLPEGGAMLNVSLSGQRITISSTPD
jgi:hypothetical protein